MYTKVHSLEARWWQKVSSKAVFFVLAGILAAMLFLYVFLVHKTIMNIVAANTMQDTVSTISGNLSSMEFQYINLKNSMNLNLAYSKGYQDITPSQFISPNQKLTYNYSD